MFRHLGGKTSGPKSFTGPLGKAMAGEVHLLPVAGHVLELPEARGSDS